MKKKCHSTNESNSEMSNKIENFFVAKKKVALETNPQIPNHWQRLLIDTSQLADGTTRNLFCMFTHTNSRSDPKYRCWCYFLLIESLDAKTQHAYTQNIICTLSVSCVHKTKKTLKQTMYFRLLRITRDIKWDQSERIYTDTNGTHTPVHDSNHMETLWCKFTACMRSKGTVKRKHNAQAVEPTDRPKAVEFATTTTTQQASTHPIQWQLEWVREREHQLCVVETC